MRKIFALMLAIAMVLTMVACGKKADNKADSMVTPELYISTVDGKDTVVDKDGKAVTGYTVHQYISQKRLLRAGELIRAGVPVMKAAEQAGFEEYSTFLRAFRGTFHMSPREFR